MSTLQKSITRSFLLVALTLGTSLPTQSFAGGGSHGCQEQTQQFNRGRKSRCVRKSRCGRKMRCISSTRSRCGGSRCRRSC